MRARRLVPPPKSVVGLHIGVRVGAHFSAANVGRLEIALGILRKRFVANVTLGLEAVEPLGWDLLSRWLADGLIDQSISSGHENLVMNDLVDAAVRSTATSAVFVDAIDVLRSPARWLKFMVEQQGIQEGATLDEDAGLLRVGQQELLTMPKLRLTGRWREGLQRVHAACESTELSETDRVAANGETGPNLTPRHLFVTKAGVNRLGGIEPFKALPIRLGGASPSAFARATMLVLNAPAHAADDGVCAEWREVVAMHPATQEESVVFDIWPAPHGFTARVSESNAAWIDVPRQILVGRRCPVPHQVLAAAPSSSEDAVFVMSNYNKAPYLHAALYGWVMQTHPSVRLEIVDDISTDDSLEKIRTFQRLTKLDSTLLSSIVNESKRGTYWIRNFVISHHRRDGVSFLINDSDDVSSALRATLQLSSLAAGEARDACLFNIVRVDKNYSPLPLNGEVERYGTASLCFKSGLIDKTGYFQNLKKNADTEFIRRVKRFIGVHSLPWLKLPVMFQPFDGGNLTADIYQMQQNSSGIAANLDLRKLHLEIAERHHARLTLEELPGSFGFPDITLPAEYAQLGDDFLLTNDQPMRGSEQRCKQAERALDLDA